VGNSGPAQQGAGGAGAGALTRMPQPRCLGTLLTQILPWMFSGDGLPRSPSIGAALIASSGAVRRPVRRSSKGASVAAARSIRSERRIHRCRTLAATRAPSENHHTQPIRMFKVFRDWNTC
jgi:hypothetical protein